MRNLSRLQLGQQSEGKQLRIAVDVVVLCSNGCPLTLRALYDSGAEINLITLRAANAIGSPPSALRNKPVATFLNDNKLRIHDPYQLDLHCADSNNIRKTVQGQIFWGAEFEGYDAVLGYPWLQEADPRIQFSTGKFDWWDNTDDRVHLTDAQELLSDI